LYVVHPRLGGWWMEVKRGKDTQRAKQKAFEQVCRRAKIGYVLGDVPEARAWLIALGVIHPSAREVT